MSSTKKRLDEPCVTEPDRCCGRGARGQRGERTLRRQIVAAALICSPAFLAVTGCGGNIAASGGSQQTLEAAQSPPNSERDDGRRVPPVVLEHDFGVVRPGARVTHRFRLQNTQAATWSIAKIINSCGCTAVDASKPVIAPGDTAEVKVAYAGAGSSRDDRRDVRVTFAEGDAPEFVLVVKAKIRERVTVYPSDVALSVSRTAPAREGLEVHNFDDVDWGGVDVRPSDPWLRAEVAHVPSGTRKTGDPRQIWRIGLIVDTAVLQPGDHSAVLTVQPAGSAGTSKSVRVDVRVRSPVAAIPSQFFFPRATASQSVEKEIMVRFHDDAVPRSRDRVTLRHDLGEQLRLEWIAAEGTLWRLKAILTPRSQASTLRGEAHVEFLDGELPMLNIPIHALLRPGPTESNQ